MGFLSKIRRVLGKVTDVLLGGRVRGWWNQGPR